ncbi:hypothetical protein GBQ70_15595 [Halomicrobium sp. ZPS1]|uniref:Uncharacterized protein n=1 Tax=Halomicrobium mukohataei TaxID=57705 RepID=A0A4D6KN94_9EURY|nr:hypothetical protein E5139_15575 [Halomicrobium mukohataei]QFR21803.1 hypothetical protein GBQ70_15595 [Halomicrobium sp. ZPS1]
MAYPWRRRVGLIRTVVGVYPVDRTTVCGRSGNDLQLSVSEIGYHSVTWFGTEPIYLAGDNERVRANRCHPRFPRSQTRPARSSSPST